MNRSKTSNQNLAVYRAAMSLIDPKIKVATTPTEVKNIEKLRDKYYRVIFPDTYKNKPDPYYTNGIHAYITNNRGRILATVSFAFPCKQGIPDQQLYGSQIAEYEAKGQGYLQMGRMLVVKCDEHEALRRRLYKFVYLASRAIGIDKILTLSKLKEIDFAENIVGGKTIIADTGKNYGGRENYAAFEWSLDTTRAEFFDWVQALENSPAGSVTPTHDTMASYSQSHLRVTPSFQSALYREASDYLYGHCIDIGCGSGKLGAYIIGTDMIDSYTGVDRCSAMLQQADKILTPLAQSTHQDIDLVHSDISAFKAKPFDSGAFIMGLQFCQQPRQVLCHIAGLIKTGGHLVLATPNRDQDLQQLEQEVRKEQIAHPDLPAFIESNLKLAKETVNFFDIATLSLLTIKAGFAVCHCHQSLYLGGVNFMVLQKI